MPATGCGSAFMPTRAFPNAAVAMNGDPQGVAGMARSYG